MITQNGVNGYLVTSKKSGYEGASIFLPTAGCRYGSSLYGVGSYGYYGASSLNTDEPYRAWYLFFSSSVHRAGHGERYNGLSIRPVCP